MAVRLAACSAAAPYEAGKQAAETETNITEAQSREGRTPDSEEAESLQEQARKILNGEREPEEYEYEPAPEPEKPRAVSERYGGAAKNSDPAYDDEPVRN